MPIVVVWLLKGLGVLALIGAVLLYRKTQQFLSAADHTSGEVIRLDPSSSSDSTTYHSVFLFTDRKGITHEVRSGVSSSPPAHKVGQKVKVAYPPDDPEKAKINSFSELHLGSLILFIFGCIILGVVAVVNYLDMDDAENNFLPTDENGVPQFPTPAKPATPAAPATPTAPAVPNSPETPFPNAATPPGDIEPALEPAAPTPPDSKAPPPAPTPAPTAF